MSYEKEQMLDRRISDMLNKKMNEPDVSPDFVARMTVRAAGIEEGRAAEKMLAADTGKTLTGAESLDLYAKCVVGRLMLTQTPPKGVTTEMMVTKLKDQPRFREAVSGPREYVLRGVRTGEIFRRIAGKRPAAEADSRQRSAEVSKPEIKTPNLGGKNRTL